MDGLEMAREIRALNPEVNGFFHRFLKTLRLKTFNTIYIRQKIDRGLQDVEAGKTLTEEELMLG